jgi:phage tail-like protein
MKFVPLCVAIAAAMLLAMAGTAASASAQPVIVSAPMFELEENGFSMPFSELKGITMSVVPKEYVYATNPSGVVVHTKQFGKTHPPEVTLEGGLDPTTFQQLMAWHQEARRGDPQAKQDATLSITSADGNTAWSYTLVNAWVAKLNISSAKAGATQTVTVTVTIEATEIVTAPSGQPSVPVAGAKSAATPHSPATPHGTAGELSGVSCVSKVACTAVGRDIVNHVNRPLVEFWNGSLWATQSAPMPAGAKGAVLNGVSCPAVNNCTAVGAWHDSTGTHTLAEAWDGSTWTIQPTFDVPGGRTNELTGVSCPSTSACQAVGYVTGPHATLALAESSTGGVWTRQPVPRSTSAGPILTELTSVSCTSSTACTAVGVDANQALSAVWDGTAWTFGVPPVPTGSTNSILNSVSCTANGDCTAAGMWTGGTRRSALVERWSGSAWSLQSMSKPKGTLGMELDGVSCSSGRSCFAAGAIVNRHVGRKLLVESWNGKTWKKVVSPNPEGEKATGFTSADCIKGTGCIAVGSALHPTMTAVMQLFAG